MNWYGPAELNLATSKQAHEYYDGLINDLDTKLDQLNQFEAKAPNECLKSSISKSEARDVRGCGHLVYTSRNVIVRLYCNYPIGYVFGEIEQNVPFTGKRKCFALHHGPRSYSGVAITQVGSFPELSYPGWQAVADFILASLLSNSITEEQLQEREVFLD